MTAAETDQACREQEEFDREVLKGVIRDRVLGTLGEPGRLGRVQVRPLWGNYYRVNVLLAQGFGCERVAASYFLETDDAGTIIRCTPALGRQGRPAVRTNSP